VVNKNFINQPNIKRRLDQERERRMMDPYNVAANAPKAPPGVPLIAEPAGAEVAAPPVAMSNAAAPNAAAPRPSADGGGGSPVVTPGLPTDLKFDPSEFDQKYKTMFGQTPEFKKRDNPFYSMKYEGDDPRKVKEEGIGFGLMKAGQALLKNPTFAGGLGDAIGAFGDQGWLTAKELKAAKKDERDYNFNMTKATELFEQGQEDKALQYAKIGQDKEKAVAELTLNAFKAKVDTFKANTDKFSANNQAKYQQGLLGIHQQQLNQPTNEMRNALYAFQNPNIAPFMSSVAKAQGTYSIEKAVDDFNRLKKEAAENPTLAKDLKKLGINSPQEYQQYVLKKSTMGDGDVGDTIRNQALAIRKERGLS
jgi:hypothetical protein